ncbi:MAG: YkgJ family cysteine cluster protein [Planctomycetota bacterium]|jgi:Fe-S-cluster containining protein
MVNQMAAIRKKPWYAAGLHFECMQCGRCCSVALIAEHLKITPGKVRERYLKRVGLRTTIIEQAGTNDCVFLRTVEGGKKCVIYPVRPSQCRSWPFWPSNLTHPGAWNKAAQKCPGINRGRRYSFEEIERLQKEKKWRQEAGQRGICRRR